MTDHASSETTLPSLWWRRRSSLRAARMKMIDADLGHWQKMGAAMFILAAVGIELVPVLGKLTYAGGWVLHACAAACLIMAVPFAIVEIDRLASIGRFMVWGGVLVISLLVATTYPVGWFALFYLWPLLAAAYIQTRLGFAGFVVAVLVAYAAALEVNGHHTGAAFPLLAYAMFALAVSIVMVAVRGLREGLDVLLDQLQLLSSTDALTGLSNRRTFEQEFVRCSEHATKTGDALTVLLFDLDHFKAINDVYGHPAGDEALRRFAALLAEARRPGDTAARVGGEEFALIMRGAGAAVASIFATDFAAVLRADGAQDTSRPPLTVSIGVAELTTHTANSGAVLIEADRALYEAKRTGRDRVVVATCDHRSTA